MGDYYFLKGFKMMRKHFGLASMLVFVLVSVLIFAIPLTFAACDGAGTGQAGTQDGEQTEEILDDDALIEAMLAMGEDDGPADDATTGNFGYIRNEGGTGVIITYVIPMPSNVVIPDALDGLPVVGFQAGVFRGDETIRSVTIPGTVTDIPAEAFQRARNLSTIVLNPGVRTIGNNAFNGCQNLVRVTLPEGLTSIGNNAFYAAQSLPVINLPEGLTTIGNAAFYNNVSLRRVTLPESLTTLGNSVFSFCYNLTELNVPSRLNTFGRTGDAVFLMNHKLPLATRDALVARGYDGRGF